MEKKIASSGMHKVGLKIISYSGSALKKIGSSFYCLVMKEIE